MNNTIQTQINDVRIRADSSSNKYPNVYFNLRLLSSEIDAKNSILIPEGCTNLRNGTGNVHMDFEHEGFYAKNKQVASNAGEITDLEVREETDGTTSLYGKARVGVEHVLTDRTGAVIGSAYASAWLTFAQSQVRLAGGNVYDYIPENIKSEFFDDKIVKPFKAISVEIDFGHYSKENYTDLRNVLTVNKYDLKRVAWLIDASEGQSYSRIEEINIRTNKIMNDNKIRCLCEANVNEFVTRDERIFQVLEKDDSQHIYTIKDVENGDETIVESQETAETYEYIPNLNPSLARSLIRMCSACEAKKKQLLKSDETEKEKPEIKTDLEIKSDTPAQVTETDKVINEMSVLIETIKELKDIIISNNSKRTIRNEEDENENEPTIVVPTGDYEESETEEIKESVETNSEKIEVSEEEPDVNAIRTVTAKKNLADDVSYTATKQIRSIVYKNDDVFF
jgi:hypothetical protein